MRTAPPSRTATSPLTSARPWALLQDVNRCGGHYMISYGNVHYMISYGNVHYSGPGRFKQALREHREVIVSLLSPAPKELCRGGCGKPMPAGQACFECAT